MDDVRIGNALRAIRIRKHLRQEDVARRARTSRQVVSRIEHGAVGRYPLDTTRAVASALGVRVDVTVRWQGAGLDRVLNSGHAALHESIARFLATLAGWAWKPEVSFSIYGERGIIDILAWHEATRSLLIIELKTQLVDPQELVATMHRRVRLGRAIAADFGWQPRTISAWVVLRDNKTDRRRLRSHSGLLRQAFPADGRTMRSWLRAPTGTIHAVSFWAVGGPDGTRQSAHAARRVRRRRVVGERTASS